MSKKRNPRSHTYEAKCLIGKDQIQEAIDVLKDIDKSYFSKGDFREIQNNIILLEAQYTDLRNKEIGRMVDSDGIDIKKNKIRDLLLKICDKIEDYSNEFEKESSYKEQLKGGVKAILLVLAFWILRFA